MLLYLNRINRNRNLINRHQNRNCNLNSRHHKSINRPHNDFGLSTSIIMESAIVASDKGSTTLLVGILNHNLMK